MRIVGGAAGVATALAMVIVSTTTSRRLTYDALLSCAVVMFASGMFIARGWFALATSAPERQVRGEVLVTMIVLTVGGFIALVTTP